MSPRSTAAINKPVRRAAREQHTSDTPVGQLPKIVMPEDGLPDRGEAIQVVEKPLDMDYLRNLTFAEEPITIIISKNPEKFAPLTVDCWCNGKGAEVLDQNNKWVEFGWLPVGKMVTTKRKYVEILARSKLMSVQTDTGNENDAEPKNEVIRSNSLKAQFSVIGDTSPYSGVWLQRLLSEQV